MGWNTNVLGIVVDQTMDVNCAALKAHAQSDFMYPVNKVRTDI